MIKQTSISSYSQPLNQEETIYRIIKNRGHITRQELFKLLEGQMPVTSICRAVSNLKGGPNNSFPVRVKETGYEINKETKKRNGVLEAVH